MKAVFEIEWADDCGEHWMNEGNLLTCLNTEEHCGKDLILNVKELTIQTKEEIREKPWVEESML